MSRPHFFEVATWAVSVGQKGGRGMDLTSRPGLVVQEVATWLGQGLGQFGVATWGRLPALFCLLFRVTVWTLFMDTVHEHCSQGKKKKKQKILKIFLGVI